MTRDRHLGSWVTTAQLPVCNRDRPVRRGHTDPSAPDAESSRTMVRRRRRVADLGFCTPSRTRTGNPLKLAARLLPGPGFALKWPLTWVFVAWLGLALTRSFAWFRADGGGVNRGLVRSWTSDGSRRRCWVFEPEMSLCTATFSPEKIAALGAERHGKSRPHLRQQGCVHASRR